MGNGGSLLLSWWSPLAVLPVGQLTTEHTDGSLTGFPTEWGAFSASPASVLRCVVPGFPGL